MRIQNAQKVAERGGTPFQTGSPELTESRSQRVGLSDWTELNWKGWLEKSIDTWVCCPIPVYCQQCTQIKLAFWWFAHKHVVVSLLFFPSTAILWSRNSSLGKMPRSPDPRLQASSSAVTGWRHAYPHWGMMSNRWFTSMLSFQDLKEWISSLSSVQFSSVAQSCLTLQPSGLQHARPPCPSPTPGVYSNSYPLSQWCHPTISSSVVPFFSHLQLFPASGSFPMSQFFASGGQSIEVWASVKSEKVNNFCSTKCFRWYLVLLLTPCGFLSLEDVSAGVRGM